MSRRGWRVERDRRRRVRRRLLLLGIVAFVLVWMAVALVLVVASVVQARDGRDALAAERDGFDLSDIRKDDAFDGLERAGRDFRAANDRISSPIVAPLRVLPFVGRQVQSLDALTGSAADALEAGNQALEEGRELLRAPLPPGPERVLTLRALTGVAEAALVTARAVDLGPENALLGPLADARERGQEELTGVTNLLERSTAVTNTVANLLEGPSAYLVLASNNAEMRSGSGMFLSAGQLTAGAGSLDIGEMRPTPRFNLEPGAVAFNDDDYEARWGGFAPNEEWRNLALSPRFDATAEMAARMWSAAGETPVQGVLAIDPFALEAVLRATGPVVADGTEVGADGVVELLLHDQYVGIDSYLPDEGTEGRRDRLASIAEAAIDALGQGDVDGLTLLEEMSEVVQGRHLLVWSSDEAANGGWEAAGVDGTLEGDSMLLSVLNRGANKLDWFLRTEASLSFERGERGVREGVVRVRLTNTTPPGEPRYVAGPFPGLNISEGEYQGFVTLNLPGTAASGRVEARDALVVAGSDGPTRVVGAEVAIPAGGSTELVFRFGLPESQTSVQIEPDARARPVRWTFGQLAWSDGRARSVAVRPRP